jgi:transcriptional antiterminator RfaH
MSYLREQSSHPALAWFCIRARPKREHIGAAYLQRDMGIEVFFPQIRFKRATRRGPVWFTEPLFPGYFFACFDFQTRLRQVHAARGTLGVVHFGDQWPKLSDASVDELRAALHHQEIYVLSDQIQTGDAVEVAGGAFHGLQAIVTRVMSGGARVAVLLDFLGRQTMVELTTESLVRCESP